MLSLPISLRRFPRALPFPFPPTSRSFSRWHGPPGASSLVDLGVSSLWRELTSLRHDLHMHPELGLEETRTSSVIAQRLRSIGLDVETGIGGTGLVASLRGTGDAQPSPSPHDGYGHARAIGLRADMDCLPMQEENEFAHRSKTDGLMHACGHDGHTTMLMGAAQFLAANREVFAGTVHFIFQPAEENAGGARMMIEDGLLKTRFKCDEVYGVHNWPYLAPGKISVREGPIMASNDEFQIRIKGRGGHAAMPHLSVDPVVIGCQLVNSLQHVVSRSVNPLKAGVLSVTQIHGGSAYNVIPESVTLKGTIRTFRQEDRESISERLQTISKSVCEGFGATCSVRIRQGYPATVNSPEQTNFARLAAQMTVGDENVVCEDPTMGAEDFSYMLEQSPGCYAWVGCHSDGKLHEPNYDFDDNIIPIGVQFFVNLVKLRMPSASTVLEEQAMGEA